MQIPDYRNRQTDRALDFVTSLKSLPMLAAVSLRSSCYLRWFYRCAYGLFALALVLVFYPFIFKQIAGLVLLVLLWWGLYRGYRYSLAQEPRGTLRYSEGYWIFERAGGETLASLQLAGSVVCWSWVVILPLRDSETGKSHYLPIFSDALTVSDNASLRRWLGACLIPKG